MSFDWKAFTADLPGASGGVFEGQMPLHFGDVEAELRAASTGTVVATLGHLGLIACRGDDSASFLHNQLTSDINHLTANRAQHSAWCTAKGRMLASFLVLRTSDGFLLQLADELVAPILKRLQMFVLRSQVKVAEASPTYVLLGVCGPAAATALAGAGLPAPAEALEVAPCAAGFVVRLDANRFELLLAPGAAAPTWQALAGLAHPVGVQAWRWLDIQAGLPLITAATKEEFVPQMTNFDQIGGVSFHKGCYPGQEVVARTQYLGKVKRHLYRLRAAADMSAGMALFSTDNPEHACGMVVTGAHSPAGDSESLAVLQENAISGEIRLRAPDGPVITAATPVAAEISQAAH